ncbi:MAG: tRNA 2-thiouridine(34) synthase MnmA [Gammaproteobacteria bacterium RIFCSPHIGHO2_12_FULL_45_9]|nr:MAG: tRNA 2-thiouridine(34) synthase MnmA [Gammaproteobacteria bacterium RIFCSPHIGHO2_12_FULL_45_9]
MTSIVEMSTAPNTRSILVGLSGGVDSAVSAALLKEQGFQVTGIFMQNWEADRNDPYCTAEQDLSDAKAVADHLHIPLLTVNFAKDYWNRVFTHCLDEWTAGRTPNPDIACNREIKFGVLLDYIRTHYPDHLLATGHYATLLHTQQGSELHRAQDLTKDQTYFLSAVPTATFASVLFPVGHLLKTETRAYAASHHLPNFAKKDSTGICFIGERRFSEFLKEFVLAKPGAIETLDGTPIGHHEGLMFYTLGQRQGLKIGGQSQCHEAPWYVVGKDMARNVLHVAQGHDHPALFSTTLYATQPNWIGTPPTLPKTLTAQVRYRQKDQLCSVTWHDSNTLHVTFETSQRAVTPGQAIVFYEGTRCLGGATISLIG